METKICIFGDSIVYGKGDYEQGGWVNRLRRFLDQETLSNPENSFEVYNLGVSGDTTTDLLKRFEVECEARLGELEKGELGVIIFAIGINDSQFIHSENNLRISPEKFEENIQKLIDLSQKFQTKIIYLGLTPVDESKTTPIPWKTNKFYMNENIQKYNEIIKLICKENNIHFIEIFENWINLDYKNLLEDGLHPNSEGHKMIFKAIKEFLIKNKLIKNKI